MRMMCWGWGKQGEGQCVGANDKEENTIPGPMARRTTWGVGDNDEEDDLLGMMKRRMTCRASDDNKEANTLGLVRRRTMWGARYGNKEDDAPGASANKEEHTPGPAKILECLLGDSGAEFVLCLLSLVHCLVDVLRGET